MRGDETRVLERLLSDREFRRRFASDPVTVAREAGLHDLANELAHTDDRDGRRLDVREPRSSAAGVFLAAAFESLGFLEADDPGVAPSGSSSPAETTPSSTAENEQPEPSVAPESATPDAEAPDLLNGPRVEQAVAPVPGAPGQAAPDASSDEEGQSGLGGAEGSDEEGSDEEGSNEEGSDGEDDEAEADEDENEGQDEIGEGSRGEDANDDESDASRVSDDSGDANESDGSADSGDSGDAPADDGGETREDSGGGATAPGVEDGIDGLDANPKALTALAAAQSELGTAYRWGGSSPSSGFDCSGLVQWAYARAGVQIPRVTYDQIDVGQRVSRSQLLPGDLVFFETSDGDVHHVGISLGGDKFLHAPHTGDVVKVSGLNESYYAREFAGGRRMAPAIATDERPDSGERQEEPDANAVRRAQRRLERDAAQARRPGTRVFTALERQEQGKGSPEDNLGSARVPPTPSAEPTPDLPTNPAADEAAEHLAQFHYGFVRDSAGTPDYGQLEAAGYNGILFHANDPNLGEAIASARAAGMESVGVWAPANLEDPATFAHRLADLQQYKPDIVVPDVEIEGKGYPGTPEWDYSEEFARLYRRLVPNQRWAVTVMPNQDDFNYGAYTSRDATVWPQTYGATYDTTFDPQSVVDRVAANGVDPRLINPVLAPNQSGAGLSSHASYALEDFQGTFPSYARPPSLPSSSSDGSEG